MPITSLNNFTVPTNGVAATQVLLMPKLKYRFRVTLLGFGVAAATELTKQVADVTRPKVSFEEGIKTMLANINYWKDAPVWNPESINNATKEWFSHLGNSNA
jgi:hypothetical protein